MRHTQESKGYKAVRKQERSEEPRSRTRKAKNARARQKKKKGREF